MTLDKPVHVDAYTKDDGTKVREHYRGLPNDMSPDPEGGSHPDALIGSISKKVYKTYRNFKENSKMYNYQMLHVQKSRITLEKSWKTAIKNAETSIAIIKNAIDWEDVQKGIKKLENAQIELHNGERELLQNLIDCEKQEEYSKAYKDYTNYLQNLKLMDDKYRVIIEAYKNQDYNTMADTINSYADYCEQKHNYYKNLSGMARNIFVESPELQKNAIGFGMFLYDKFLGCYDAKALWKLSSSNFREGLDYISKNGCTLKSIAYTPLVIRKRIQDKVYQQLGVKDCIGILFNSKSSLSKSIVKSVDFQSYIIKHLDALKRGEVVNDSINFVSETNLHLSLGHADILDMCINEAGELTALVLDTYDFNEDDPDFKVEIAHNVQEHGLLTNYYTLTFIKLPKALLDLIINNIR